MQYAAPHTVCNPAVWRCAALETVDRCDNPHSLETWVHRHLQQPPLSKEEKVVLQIFDAPRTERTKIDVLSHKLGVARFQSFLFVSRHIAKAEDRLRALVTHHLPIRHSTDSTDTVDNRRSWMETVKVRLMTKR